MLMSKTIYDVDTFFKQQQVLGSKSIIPLMFT